MSAKDFAVPVMIGTIIGMALTIMTLRSKNVELYSAYVKCVRSKVEKGK